MIYISGKMQLLNFNIIKFEKILLITGLFSVLPSLANAQSEKKFIRQGNREYQKNKYSESEISYRRAIDKNKSAPDAVFNVGDALYKQKKFEDAGKQFVENNNMNEAKEKKATALYNLGNANLMAKKLQESIDAYMKSLLLNPRNMEAKYNLAYAQDLLKQQQQQQQQNKDKQEQNKDQNKNKDDKKKQDQKQDNKEQQNNNQEQKQQNQQQQQQNISKEDAERLLKAQANDEEKVQEKVKLAKAAKSKERTLKNW
jgi:Ca-activated chloride channel family protein